MITMKMNDIKTIPTNYIDERRANTSNSMWSLSHNDSERKW